MPFWTRTPVRAAPVNKFAQLARLAAEKNAARVAYERAETNFRNGVKMNRSNVNALGRKAANAFRAWKALSSKF